MTHFHPFHLVTISPWPTLASLNILTALAGSILFISHSSLTLMSLSCLTLMMTTSLWWRDVTRESTFQGNHPSPVIKGLKLGMILFIISEIMFFSSFFWTFFHSSLSVSPELTHWPPKNIWSFDPFTIPLLNTSILLSSGISITWAHHSMINHNKTQTIKALVLTLSLGFTFSILQAYEYSLAPFSINDSAYGSCFFMATGFHGIHVIIGSTFILVTLFRTLLYHLSANHHFGFEAAAWYWHFVDVVWLFLFTSIYWWGN